MNVQQWRSLSECVATCRYASGIMRPRFSTATLAGPNGPVIKRPQPPTLEQPTQHLAETASPQSLQPSAPLSQLPNGHTSPVLPLLTPGSPIPQPNHHHTPAQPNHQPQSHASGSPAAAQTPESQAEAKIASNSGRKRRRSQGSRGEEEGEDRPPGKKGGGQGAQRHVPYFPTADNMEDYVQGEEPLNKQACWFQTQVDMPPCSGA